MFPPELKDHIKNKKSFCGKLDLPSEMYPTWDELVPWFDNSYVKGNKRARDPHKIFADVKAYDFPIVRNIQIELGKLVNMPSISCHCYAGFSPNAIASPPHKDGMEVFFVMIQGSMPWKIFENGCDYDDKSKTMTTRSTFSSRLTQGTFVYVPTGVYHVALPDSSRVGFSFGW